MEQIIQNTRKRDLLVITGDFNARIGKQNTDFEDGIGNYEKGEQIVTVAESLQKCVNVTT